MRPPSGVPFLDGLNRFYGYITEGFNVLGTAWILALMLLINADAAGRSFFQSPITGVPEIVSLSIVGIVFLQLASALRNGSLTRSDMLLSVLMRRWPRVGEVMESLFHLAGAVTLWFLLQASWPRFITAWERGETVGVVGRFLIPTWPIKLILVVGTVAMLIQFLLFAVMSFVRAVRPPAGDAPSAQPDGGAA